MCRISDLPNLEISLSYKFGPEAVDSAFAVNHLKSGRNFEDMWN